MSIATRTDPPSIPHVADRHDLIRVHGARENNLKDVSVEIPKRRLTVFTGSLGFRQELARLRHHRRRVAAAHQRDLQRVRPGLHAEHGPSRRRPPRRADHGDHRGPGADGRQRPLHRRHGDRCQRDAAHPVQPARAVPHVGSPQAYSFNIPSVRGERRDHRRAWCGQAQDREPDLLHHRRHVSALRRPGHDLRHRPHRALRRLEVDRRGRDHHPRLQGRTAGGPWGSSPSRASSTRTNPSATITKQELDDFLYKEPTKVKVQGVNLTYEGLVPKVQKSFLSKDPEALQPHIRAFVERAATFTACPDCGGTRLSEGARSSKIQGINIADACAMQISDLAEWVRGLDEPSVAPLLAGLQRDPRLVRGDRARLPLARPVRRARCRVERPSAPR